MTIPQSSGLWRNVSDDGPRRYAVGWGSDSTATHSSNVEVAFHAINKSGSFAIGTVMREAFDAHGRSKEMLSHYEVGGSREAFVKTATVGRSTFVMGHDLFGAIQPSAERVWVTQFRHPLPKVLSSFNWLKLKHEQTHETPFMNLEEFAMKSKGISHSLVKQFGFGGQGAIKGRTAEDLLEKSIEELEVSVEMIGLAERFEETIFLFAQLCGLPSVVPWVRDQRNPGRPLSTEITDHERTVVEYMFSADYALYAYALMRFDHQLRAADFGVDLMAYKTACADQYNDRIL